MEFSQVKPKGRTAQHVEAFETLRANLQRSYGYLSTVIEKYGGRAVVFLSGREYEVFNSVFDPTQLRPQAFLSLMASATGVVNKAIGKLQSPALSESVATLTTLAPPKAFIAHGGRSPALTKLCDFLPALGVKPLVVEDEPSEGRSIGAQVTWFLDRCDCAIVLATKGDIDGNTGEFIPRGNVLNEIGRFQERFSKRIVYLIESGTKFPTNISEKVWERFTQDNMEMAFIKVAKELTAFGLIKAVKPE